MPLTRRFATIVKAKLSRLLDQAERPDEILDYGYERQVEQLYKLRRGMADLVAAKHRIQGQQRMLEQKAMKLDHQARQALAAGQEELARTALERKQIAKAESDALTAQIDDLEAQQQRLTASEQQLRARIEAFRTRKDVIKAQYSAAEAQVRISEAATGVGGQMADVGLALQRALDKTAHMQARAEAVAELEASGAFDDLASLGPAKDDIDRQLDALGASSAVDSDLARIRAELGSSTHDAQIEGPHGLP
jgi:phage shock protein A